LGVRLAIDDFGTGYSSLSYLPRLPVDVIKIDRAFITEMIGGPDSSTLTRTIVELCQRLSLDTIAEGVEHEEQAESLRAIGCRAAQGWLYAPALRPEDVPAPGTVLDPRPTSPV
jgi:EAL domain-containing protein (putative c-di-GMP-specific phosphodiesterase class I)